MKRSEINKALKELEATCEKYHCYLPPSAISPPNSGRTSATSMMKFVTAAWVGTSPTMAWATLTRWASL